jgi:small-conductance mechanosensitive channel
MLSARSVIAHRRHALLACFVAFLSFVPFACPAQAAVAAVEKSDLEQATAPVIIDGNALFRVRGASSYPPEERAEAIAARIIELARDPNADTRDIRIVETPTSSDLVSRRQRLMSVLEADAALEGVDRRVLATHIQERVQRSIEAYRQHRTPAALKKAVKQAAFTTAMFVPGLWMLLWLFARFRVSIETRYRQRVPSVGIQSFQILHAQQVWFAVQRLLGAVRLVTIAIVSYVFLEFVLSLFPWTRPLSRQLLSYLTGPLTTMGRAILDYLPDLIFLVLLLVVARYILRVIRLFFDALERGRVTLGGFEPQWAPPSYRLARLGVIVFTAVLAYPYIPGSGSEAFKGISILLGVMFSISSSSFLANIVAGYALIYRRLFTVGDRVQIDDVVGDVVQTRLQVTRLRSLKGEEVIVPNSLILNSKVVNYSSLANKHGLILHTKISIGYEVPWRKVEYLLLSAADRTPGLLREPKPFVSLRSALGEFAVTYELNVYCDNAQAMQEIYTTLHHNILDIFNEHGVQIMTPAYEGDPPSPKVVAKDEWFDAPAAVHADA